MAKYLGSRGLEQMRDMFLKNDPSSQTFLEREMEVFPERNIIQTKQYRMCDLFPDTYKTMTEIPADMDFSQLRSVDELFKGCKALKKVDGLDISNAVSAAYIFQGCTSLESVTNLKAPNVTDWHGAFLLCPNLKEVCPIDMSRVTRCQHMFEGDMSLPSTWPWPMDLRAALHDSNMTTINGVFSDTNVTNITIAENLRIPSSAHDESKTDNVESDNYKVTDGSFITCVVFNVKYDCDVSLKARIENALIEYVNTHGMPTTNTLALPLDIYCDIQRPNNTLYSNKDGVEIGAKTRTIPVDIPDVKGFLDGALLVELRHAYLLALAQTINQCPGGVESADKWKKTSNIGYSLKSYDEKPDMYQDITVYTPTMYIKDDAKSWELRMKFTPETQHVLKPNVNLTLL